MIGRRTFLQRTASAATLAGFGDLAFLSQLPRVSAAEAKLPAKMVQLHLTSNPRAPCWRNTPRARVLEEVAAKIKRGTTYREVLAALMLAGTRSIQRGRSVSNSRVLVVNSRISRVSRRRTRISGCQFSGPSMRSSRRRRRTCSG